MSTFDTYFEQLIPFILKHEPMNPDQLGLKCTEELGELAEQILYHGGQVQHKTMKEPIENELGDLINCAMGAVVKTLHNQGVCDQEIKDRILAGCMAKLGKYQTLIDELKNK